MQLVKWNNEYGVFDLIGSYLFYSARFKIVKDDVTWLIDSHNGDKHMCTSPGKAKELADDITRKNLIELYQEQLLIYKDFINMSYSQLEAWVYQLPVRRWYRFKGELEDNAECKYELGHVRVYAKVTQLEPLLWRLELLDNNHYPTWRSDAYTTFRAAKHSGIKYLRLYFVHEIGVFINEMISLASTIGQTKNGWEEDNINSPIYIIQDNENK